MHTAEHAPNPTDPHEAVILNSVLRLASEQPLFAPDAPIVQYITERVAVLCGDEYEMPKVLVRDCENRNACVLPGYMIVDSGLLDIFEFQEEIDAILAHEVSHLSGHHHDDQPGGGILRRTGKIRAHEVEADLVGATLMDRRGINPRGAISAFAKLAASTKGQSHWTASATHGHLADRAINVDQSFFLYDARNLSDAPLTPLRVREKADRGRTVTDVHDPVLEQQPLLAQATLGRQMRDCEAGSLQAHMLIEQQIALLQHTEPELSDNDARRLAMVICHKYRQPRQESTVASLVTADTITLADAQQLVVDMEDPRLVRQCGSFDRADRHYAASTFAERALADGRADTAEAIAITQALRAGTESYSFLLPPVHNVITAHRTDRSCITNMADIVAPTNLQMASFTESFGPTLEVPLQNHFCRRIAIARMAEFERLKATGDEFAVLRYVANSASQVYGDDFLENGDGDVQELSDELELAPSFEAYTWHLYLTTGDARSQLYEDATRAFRESPVVQYTGEITDGEGMDLARELAGRADLSPEDRKVLAEVIIEAEGYLTAHTLERQIALLPILAMGGRRKAIKRILEAAAISAFNTTETHKDLGEAALIDLLAEVHAAAVIPQPPRGRRRRNHYRQAHENWRKWMQEQGDGYADQEHFAETLDEIAAESAIIRDHALIAALEGLHHDQNAGPLLALLQDKKFNRIRGGGAFVENQTISDARKFWEASAATLLKQPDLLTNDQHLLTLVALGMCAENIEVNLHVPAEALRRIVQLHTFDEGLALVFEAYAHLPAYVLQGAIEELVECKARTLEDFAELDKYMRSYVTQFIDEEQMGIGLGSIIETNIIDAYKTHRESERSVGIRRDSVAGMESSRLMGALLNTVESDEDIRKYIFERWWIANRTTSLKPDLEGYFKVEEIAVYRHRGKEARLAHWIRELPPPGEYEPLEEILNNLYLSNNGARYVAVRKILLGEGGVLADEAGRKSLVEGLMKGWLNYEEDSQAYKVLHNLLTSLMESAQSDDLYRLIGPILQELILRPPRRPADNSAIARTYAEALVAEMGRDGRLPNPTEADINSVHQKILNLMRGGATTTKRKKSAASDMLALFADRDAYEFKRVSPTELALMAGKKSGALGVRMLQLAGQYYTIPEEERETYNEVYDSMRGQTRYQAYRLLIREAEHSPALAQLLTDMATFDERLGGGSLVTVYGITLKDGSKEVIGVRNPNAQYHVGQVATIVLQALDKAIEHDPDNVDLHLARSLVLDPVTWIRDELNDVEFNAKDAIFRAENDTITGDTFRKGRSRYDVYVPPARATDSLWIRREAYVEGENIGKLTVSDDEPTSISDGRISREDYKDAISTLARSCFFQIRQGSFAHPDVHPGNFRITTENDRLAVFDRYNLIPITDALRDTLKQTFQAGFSGEMQTAVEAIIRFAASSQALDIPGIAAQVATSLGQHDDLTAGMGQTVIELKKIGIKLPYHLSLMLRNIFVLARMAEEAGFSNLAEAFLHTADEQEITDTLAYFA